MVPQPKQNKRILLLHTGGTIGMGLPKPPVEKPLTPDDRFVKKLFGAVPELKRLAAVTVKGLCNKDSSQITPADWIRVAEAIGKYYDDYDGFVVTHGTDTMAFTATAVSYLLPHPCKPVVFTGSQRPLGEIRTDARRNLICSVAYAAGGAAPRQQVLETCIFFDTVLLRANRAVKVHIEEFHAFDSPNFPKLAEERLHSRYNLVPKAPCRRPALPARFDGHVQVVHPFPGQQVTLDPKAHAVYVLAFGCGNLPLDESSMVKLLQTCKRKKIPVLLGTQVMAGATMPEIYEMGRRALDLGAIPTGDMTFPAALIKAMVLAANQVPYNRWMGLVTANWAGELTPPPS
jgi:L-asparaginase